MNVFWVHSKREFSPSYFQPPVQVSTPSFEEDVPTGPYSYLGHGKQSMAFESSNKNHVLKLFYWKRPIRKTWYRSVENWLRFASPRWIGKAFAKKSEVRKLFERYLWAYDDLRVETALSHVHFAKTIAPIPITLIDRDGKHHILNLAEFPFVIQKKVALIPEYMKGLEMAKAKEAFEELRHFFHKRISMGYLDNPEVFSKNYGFLDGKAVQIDVGQLRKVEHFDLEEELGKVYRNLDKHVKKRYAKVYAH